MSKVSISGDENGTADFTIKAPATNTDRVLDLPDEAGSVLTDVSDIETQVKTSTNATGDAPIYACRAWGVITNGPTIVESGNISSNADTGPGEQVINFSSAMPDADYAIIGSLDAGSPSHAMIFTLDSNVQPTTTSFKIRCRSADGQADNAVAQIYFAVMR